MLRLSCLCILFLILLSFATIAKCAGTKRILVLGGTGFVGGSFVKAASATGKYSIVAASRRGKPTKAMPASLPAVEWAQTDATDAQQVDDLFKRCGPFDVCVHAVGLLFDQSSGLRSLNAYASGSGSVPDSRATYDRITRATAINAIQSFTAQQQQQLRRAPPRPFLFLSAAEAGWSFTAPLPWLERYLMAKRAVEEQLLRGSDRTLLRPVVFRPSLVWTPARPQALPSVLPFYAAAKLGVPFVDRPVTVDTLVGAMLAAVEDDSVVGVQRYAEMDSLAARSSL